MIGREVQLAPTRAEGELVVLRLVATSSGVTPGGIEELAAALAGAGASLLVRWLVLPSAMIGPPGHLEVFIVLWIPAAAVSTSIAAELLALLALAAPAHRFEEVHDPALHAIALDPFGPAAWSLELSAAPKERGRLGFEAAAEREHGSEMFTPRADDGARVAFLLASHATATVLDCIYQPLDAAVCARPRVGTGLAPIGLRARWTGSAGTPPSFLRHGLARALTDGVATFHTVDVREDGPSAPGDFAIASRASLFVPPARAIRVLAPDHWRPGPDRVPVTRLSRLGLLLGHAADRRPVFVDDRARMQHTWIIGQTGTGKSTLLANQVRQDLERGHGLTVLVPHGEVVDQTLAGMPAARRADVLLLDVTGPIDELPSINLLECRTVDEAHVRVGQVVDFICTLWPRDFAGPMFHQAATNALLLLAARFEDPGTLADLQQVFLDAKFRASWVNDRRVAERVPEVVRWWKSYEDLSSFTKSESLNYYISKFSLFAVDPVLRRVLGRARSSLDLRAAMDERKVVLCKLGRATANPVSASMLTAVIMRLAFDAALSRRQETAVPHFLYADEFQRIAGPNTAAVFSEVRKYGLALTIAHQFVDQLPSEVLSAILGNVGTKVLFRVGLPDAQRLVHLDPGTTVEELIHMPNFEALVHLVADHRRRDSFHVRTLGPPVSSSKLLRTNASGPFGKENRESAP